MCELDHTEWPGLNDKLRAVSLFEVMLVDEDLMTLVYARGDDRPLLNLTIGGLLERTANQFPDRLAVAARHQQKRMSWAELSAAADQVARGLWSLWIRRGDRVGIWSTNCIEWVMLHVGCARAGAAWVDAGTESYHLLRLARVQVVGILNARLSEIVVAWIRLRPGMEATEAEIREWCQGQIAYYKIPDHVRFVTEFPATLSGKIQKYKIREFEIEARGLHNVAKTATA